MPQAMPTAVIEGGAEFDPDDDEPNFNRVDAPLERKPAVAAGPKVRATHGEAVEAMAIAIAVGAARSRRPRSRSGRRPRVTVAAMAEAVGGKTVRTVPSCRSTL